MDNLRIKILTAFVVTLTLSSAYGCFVLSPTCFGMRGGIFFSTPSIKSPPINFGFELWPGFLIVPLAEKLGYFQDEGLNVELHTYLSVDDLVDDVRSGKINARAGLTSEIVYEARDHGIHAYIVLITDRSLGADAVLTRKGARPIAISKGSKIAYIGKPDFFVEWALRSFNMSPKDYEFIDAGSEEASVELLQKGLVDHIITYEPYVSMAKDVGATEEYTSAASPGVITDVIAFNAAYVEEYGSAIEAFARAYFRAYDFWKTNPNEAYRIVRNTFHITESEFRQQMRGIEMLDKDANKSSMYIYSGLGSIYGNIRLINLFANQYTSIPSLNPDRLIYPNAIRSLP
ncbi:MAG TPA: ABC transporter substrate-binding protein [Candidatus Paceibacterota bacterium]|nr:ABC transporter substrate-binding protein [Candidatus Paceibacterota bacterium]